MGTIFVKLDQASGYLLDQSVSGFSTHGANVRTLFSFQGISTSPSISLAPDSDCLIPSHTPGWVLRYDSVHS
ncbi:hypothetical protein GIB67_023441 [Kingdonia uniflora]|uniref:Uncharacterized protein n=1 Tax=Kingdonia uniflora TaxID=39325 RepID=A0A7J7P9Y3_9MAGN|nr:hypothetical protein GIB67_023441 [Kingdonia uniflora]